MSAHIVTEGSFPRCIGTHTVVLYDVKTGRVHHRHQAFIFEGPRPSNEAMEQLARKNAAHRGGPLPDLAALHLTDVPLAPDAGRVDVAQRKLVQT